MKKIGIILITAAIVAGCTERELIMPDAPSNPDREGLIVPSATVSGMVSAEETAARYAAPDWMIPTTRGTTRAASYPYVTTNAKGKANVIVTKDADGETAGATFHGRWEQTPAHTDASKDATGAFINSRSPRFEVAEANALDSSPWGETNTGCTAPWRRPTWDELQVIYNINAQLANPLDKVTHFWYAAATESAAYPGEGCHVNFSSGRPGSATKNNQITVRCVRDLIYPYVTTNADGKMSVIVSQDEYGTSGEPLHVPWQQTPQHVYTNATLNSISYRFEVAQTESNGAWTGTNVTCTAPWRMPTYAELVTMYKARTQLELSTPFTQGYTYWSASETDASNVHVLNFNGTADGYTGNDPKARTNTFRCIRDLTLALPGSSGSPSFTLTAFAGATEPINWQTAHFPATDVKATATGFEMSTPRYFPANGAHKAYFYATAPACTNYAQGSASVEPKATYDISHGNVDVMWTKDVRGIAKNSDPTKQVQPSLLFRHVLKQVQFKVKADDTFDTGKKLTGIVVEDANTKVSINLITGESTFEEKSFVVLNLLGTPVTLTTATTNVGMLMFEPGATFTLTASTDDLTQNNVTYKDIPVTLTGGTNPGAAGTANVVTLTFKRQAVEATATIGAWAASVDGGTIDVN